MNGKKRGGGFEDALWELKRKDPFTPFRVSVASGERFLIQDPEMMVISPVEVIYVVPRTSNVVRIRKSQITAIEELHGKTAV